MARSFGGKENCMESNATVKKSTGNVNVFRLVISLIIPLAVGIMSATLSGKGMQDYASMVKPPLSPPAWVFSVAWTILYLMMGFAAYLVCTTEGDLHHKTMAMIFYWVQLLMNFMWSIVFFNWKLYLVAFIWLMVMWMLVILCAYWAFKVNRKTALLLAPYILWLTFAAYLNMGTFILNMK